jgi:hypothetical protein
MVNKIIRDLPAEEYHSLPAISKHGLDTFHRSPALFQYLRDNPSDPSPAMRWGTLVHLAVLEPKRYWTDVAVAPEINRRTKEGKIQWEEFCARNDGKLIIEQNEKEILESMVTAIFAHPAAIRALPVDSATIEASIFWRDDLTGVDCRCRPDLIHPRNVIVDLKTCEDASPSGLSRSAAKFRYHVQSAMYLDAYEAATGSRAVGFSFVAVEKTPPYQVAVYAASSEFVAAGRREYQSDLARYAECLATNQWPGYGDEVLTLDLPKWAN